MKLFDYLDCKYQNYSISGSKQFSIATDGKAKSAYMLIGLQRLFFKYAWVPILVGEWLLVTVKLKSEPESFMKKKLANIQEQAQAIVIKDDTVESKDGLDGSSLST